MNTERKFTVVKQCMIAIGIVINIVGAFLALNLRLPVYLDSIGTVLVSGLLGPGLRYGDGSSRQPVKRHHFVSIRYIMRRYSFLPA